MYVDGLNFRRIARHLSVNHQTVINWIRAPAANIPPLPTSPHHPRPPRARGSRQSRCWS